MELRVRRALSAFILCALAVHVACLKDLDEPTACPGAPVFEFCAGGPPAGPGGPSPTPPVDSCNLRTNECLLRRGDCRCSSTDECKRTSSTCYPVPTCPKSIRQIDSNAQCIEVGAPPSNPGGPPSGPPGTGTEGFGPDCICGCETCATTCDGRGPVFGGDATGKFSLGDLPAAGSLGLMIRSRGVGVMTATLRVQDGSPVILGEAGANGPEFSEGIARRPDGMTYSWSDERRRPRGIEIKFGREAQVEVDCVIPWVTR